ncbi:unnamed protein product [Tilletia laevis]|nr:unnamed protein product [Tilletia laevis]
MYEDIDSDRSDVFVTLPGHRANIFTLSWSCDGQHLFSGGMDGRVHQYDLQSLSNLAKRPRLSLEPGQQRRTLWARQPSIHPSAVLSAPVSPTGLEFLLGTTPAIREVSAHPYNPALVLACTQNGLLTMNDVRLPAPGFVGCARLSARRGLFALAGRSFSGVQWRPLASDGNTFAVCISTASNRVDAANINVKAGTRLYDARMCFRSSDRSGGMDAMNVLDTAGILNDDNAVVLYDSVLERFDRRSDDEVYAYFAVADGVNVRFDPTGQFLVSDATGFKPIIYEVGQSQPIAVCEAKGYATRCTTKHGSFGRFGTDLTKVEEPPSDRVQDARDERGPAVREAFTLPKVERDGLYYVTGSDDFRGYGWAIPSVESLVARREAVKELSILRGERPIDGLYFVSKNGAPVWVPRLNKPAFTLDGAQSITNTTLAHPHLPLIATSGIERLVRLYSPLPFSTHDELPEDGSLSVPLLRPGLTRQIGKKPALPTGANDERDSIDIAHSSLSNHHYHAGMPISHSMRANDRLLRTRKLCRQGDIGDASTIAQFDEYLLEEEKDRREKRRRLAGAARSAAAGGRGGGVGRGRGAKEEVREEVRAEGEGEELFRAKPDIMYSLRRIFKEAQEGKGKAASAGAGAGAGAGATGRLSSTAMTKIGSNSTDGGATSAGSSSCGINLTPPKAKRPWRRSADRPVFVGQEEGEEEQTGVGVGDRGVEVHDRGRTSHEDSQEAEDEDEDEMDGSTSASSDRSDDVGTDTVHQSDDDEDDDNENEKEEEGEGGGPDWSQNWVLRAARRLGLQQLSAHRPARLAGGVWEVRHSATPPTGAAAAGARGFEIVPRRFGRWEEMEMGGDDDDDDEEEEAAAAEEMFLSPDEDDSEDDDGEGEGEGRTRAAVAPLPDRDADGLTEYERWMRQDLPRIRSSGRAEGMDLDEDEDEDDEDDEEEEEDYEGGAGGGGDVGADEDDDDDDDDADDGAVAYRRLGRDRP